MIDFCILLLNPKWDISLTLLVQCCLDNKFIGCLVPSGTLHGRIIYSIIYSQVVTLVALSHVLCHDGVLLVVCFQVYLVCEDE